MFKLKPEKIETFMVWLLAAALAIISVLAFVDLSFGKR